MATDIAKTLNDTGPIGGRQYRLVSGIPVAPGTYRIGNVFVSIEFEEIVKLKDDGDMVSLVRRKLKTALDRVNGLPDIDDFAHLAKNFEGRAARKAGISEAAGPVAALHETLQQGNAPE